MKLEITQKEIDTALRSIVEGMGFDLTGKEYSVDYSLSRKPRALSAVVIITAAGANTGVPDFGFEDETKPAKTTVKEEAKAPVDTTVASTETAPEVMAETAAEPEVATAGADASIFGDE